MSKTKILYVEDEAVMAHIVSETLQSRGYDVVLETRGDTAVDVFKETHTRCVCAGCDAAGKRWLCYCR